MSRSDLDAALAALKRELAAMQDLDQARKAQLESLVQGIERRLDEEAGQEQHHGVLESVRGAIETFEASHPRATAILNDIMVTLSNMGI